MNCPVFLFRKLGVFLSSPEPFVGKKEMCYFIKNQKRRWSFAAMIASMTVL